MANLCRIVVRAEFGRPADLLMNASDKFLLCGRRLNDGSTGVNLDGACVFGDSGRVLGLRAG